MRLPHLVHSVGEQFAYFRYRCARISRGECQTFGEQRCLICDLAWDALRSGMREQRS